MILTLESFFFVRSFTDWPGMRRFTEDSSEICIASFCKANFFKKLMPDEDPRLKLTHPKLQIFLLNYVHVRWFGLGATWSHPCHGINGSFTACGERLSIYSIYSIFFLFSILFYKMNMLSGCSRNICRRHLVHKNHLINFPLLHVLVLQQHGRCSSPLKKSLMKHGRNWEELRNCISRRHFSLSWAGALQFTRLSVNTIFVNQARWSWPILRDASFQNVAKL